jgi:hypothetical protein
MAEAIALRNRLLDWLYEKAGDRREIVQADEFTQAHDLNWDRMETLIGLCQNDGLVVDHSSGANPHLELTPAGLSDVIRRRQRRTDPNLRRTAARTELVRWFRHAQESGQLSPRLNKFLELGIGFEDEPFTYTEIENAADYLSKKELIKGSTAGGHVFRGDITDSGMDCVDEWDADVSRYLRQGHSEPTMTTYNGPVFHGAVNGAQFAWNNETATQIQNEFGQPKPGFEDVASVVTEIMQRLSAMGLPEDQMKTADSVARGLLVETSRDEPDREVIHRGRLTLQGILAPLAVGLTTGAGEGVQELARHLIERLGALLT